MHIICTTTPQCIMHEYYIEIRTSVQYVMNRIILVIVWSTIIYVTAIH